MIIVPQSGTDLGVTLLDKIQKLQNRAARIITQSKYHTSASNLLEELGWDNVSTRWKKQKAIFMFKTLNNRAPEYLRNLFTDRNLHYSLRDTCGKLNLPRPCTDYMKQSFSYCGAHPRNNLPESIRTIKSFKIFKKPIKITIKTISRLPHGNLVKQNPLSCKYACDVDY